jgi:hypothetical protein
MATITNFNRAPYTTLRDETLMTTKVVEDLTTALGIPLKVGNLKVMRNKGKGPKYICMGREVWYSVEEIRSFIEARLGMSIRSAVEIGRIKVPPRFAVACGMKTIRPFVRRIRPTPRDGKDKAPFGWSQTGPQKTIYVNMSLRQRLQRISSGVK